MVIPAGPADRDAADAERFRALRAAGAVGVAIGVGDVITEADDELRRLLGRTAEEITRGLPWPAITPPDQIERDAAALREIRRAGSALLVKDLLRRDGTRVTVLAVVVATGWDPYRWTALVLDVSRDQQLRRLVETEAAIVTALLDDAPIGFALIDSDLHFVRVNRELAAMNGRSVAEHEGVRVFDVVPGLQASAEPLLREVLESGRPLRDIEIVGWTDADPGEVHTWLESFFPVRVPGGAILGVAAVARDVTDVRRLQRELDATVERQRAALRDLQNGLLPVLPDVPGVQLQARYSTASREVHLGGDWYDAIEAPDGRLVLCVGDVVGHGLSAVGVMAQASGAVRAYVCDGYGPGDVLTRLARLLGPAGDLATAVVASLDRATGVLEYANAGHPLPLLRHPDGTVDQLDGARGPMLGAVPGARFPTGTVQVQPGSDLVFFTDGLVERRGEDLDVGVARLAAAVGDRLGDGPGDLADRVLERCLSGPVLDDDVCVLVLTRLPG